MKQHGSVFMLFVRSSFYKVLVVLAAMILAESVWFYRTIQGLLEKLETGELTVMTPEVVFEEAHLMVLFAAAVIIVTVFLACVGRSSTGHQEYTLYRLSISPKSIFLWQAVYNIGCLVLLWFVQAITAFGLCQYYIQTADASAVTYQSLFLAFYREPFLHALMPLQNVWCWIRNVLLFGALGVSLAYDVYCTRRGKNRMWLWWMILCFSLFRFRFDLSSDSSGCGIDIAVYLMIIAVIGFFTLVEGVWDLDEAERKA